MKRILCILLAAMLMLALTACGGEKAVPQLDCSEIGSVMVSPALYSSTLYFIEDEEGIAETVKLYNALTYAETDDAPDDLLTDTLYTVTFYDKDDQPLQGCSISPRGYIKFNEDYSRTYRLTSDFDEEALKQILSEHNAA